MILSLSLKVSKKFFGIYVCICVTSFVGSVELLESEQEKAESDCAIPQNQSDLTRNRPSLPQRITSGGCINKPLLTLNGKSINEADTDAVLHSIT